MDLADAIGHGRVRERLATRGEQATSPTLAEAEQAYQPHAEAPAEADIQETSTTCGADRSG